MISRFLESRMGETRALRDPKWGRWGTGSDAGDMGAISTDKAMSYLMVYGCVQLISDVIATLPVHIMQGRDIVDNPLWVDHPEPLDRVDFVSALLVSLLTEGNAFVAVSRDNRGRTLTVDPLDPRRVGVKVTGPMNEPEFTIDNKPYPGEILMIRGVMRPGSIRGISPVELARQTIGIGLGGQEQAVQFFRQGAITPGVIHSKSDLTSDQARDIRDQWLHSHGGTNKSHLPVVLTGDTEWQSISMTAEQAQFLESRNFTDAQIAGQLFLLDPSIFGIVVNGGSLTYQNIEQRGAHLVRYSLLRWIIRLERGLTHLLPPGQEWKFNVDGLTRGDLGTRYSSYKTAAEINALLGMPLLSVQEMRDLENLGPAVDTGKPAPDMQPPSQGQ